MWGPVGVIMLWGVGMLDEGGPLHKPLRPLREGPKGLRGALGRWLASLLGLARGLGLLPWRGLFYILTWETTKKLLTFSKIIRTKWIFTFFICKFHTLRSKEVTEYTGRRCSNTIQVWADIGEKIPMCCSNDVGSLNCCLGRVSSAIRRTSTAPRISL